MHWFGNGLLATYPGYILSCEEWKTQYYVSICACTCVFWVYASLQCNITLIVCYSLKSIHFFHERDTNGKQRNIKLYKYLIFNIIFMFYHCLEFNFEITGFPLSYLTAHPLCFSVVTVADVTDLSFMKNSNSLFFL